MIPKANMSNKGDKNRPDRFVREDQANTRRGAEKKKSTANVWTKETEGRDSLREISDETEVIGIP